MKLMIRGLVGVVAAAVVVTGCSAPGAGTPASSTPSSPVAAPVGRAAESPRPELSASPSPVATPSPTPSPTRTPTPTPAPTPSTHPTDSPKAGKATGPITDTPFEVDGIPVVSKDHRLSASYVPPWAGEPNGLHPDATAGFKALQAAAKADGLRLTIRSGYRSHATQKASFANARKQYNEKTARLYFAEAGASEHQLGLALDAWDGKNRGTAFARTPHARWLAEHAHEFGFIVRYPQGYTHVIGFIWEPWHVRYVGVDVATAMRNRGDATYEQYLGVPAAPKY